MWGLCWEGCTAMCNLLFLRACLEPFKRIEHYMNDLPYTINSQSKVMENKNSLHTMHRETCIS